MAANVNRLLVNIYLPQTYISRSLQHYTQYETKRKRLKKWNEHPDNLSWGKLLFERQKELSNKVEEEVSPMHVVQLIKTLNRCPWWEKQICEELGIGTKMHQPILVKNIPGVNKMLFEVKHLLKIQPLKLPNGLPSDPSDFQHMTLKSNGELVFKKRLETSDNQRVMDADEPSEDSRFQKNRMSLETIKKVCDKKKVDFEVNSEFFDTTYEFKRNQDGKMYRYNFNKDTPKYEWHW